MAESSAGTEGHCVCGRVPSLSPLTHTPKDFSEQLLCERVSPGGSAQGKDGIPKQGIFFVESGQQAVSQLAHLKLALLLELMVS